VPYWTLVLCPIDTPSVTVVPARAKASARTASERLAEHVVGLRFEDLPAEVVERAKDLITYSFGLAFAGTRTGHGRALVSLALELSAGGGSSTIVGETRRATLLDAILANSELLGDDDDHHLPSQVRVGRVSQSALWALAEREHSSGREAITALVLAYDTACTLAELHHMEGRYNIVPHKCAFAPFAPAAIASRLLGHDRGRTASTIGRAAHHGMGLNAGLSYAFEFSTIAQKGVQCALLPEPDGSELLDSIDGPLGLYATIYDGVPAQLDEALGRLGRDYKIMAASTKRYPGSASHIAPLEAARELFSRERLTGTAVERIVAVLPDEFRGRFAHQENRMDWAREPGDEDLAVRASLRLKLALLLVTGEVVPRPTAAQWRDERVQAAMPKIDLVFEPIPQDRALIEVRLTDGRALREEGRVTPYPRGDWGRWLRADGARFLREAKLARLEKHLNGLEEVDDFADVMACVTPDGTEAPERR
jgi:2-methylcitrate dehydratase PrpD